MKAIFITLAISLFGGVSVVSQTGKGLAFEKGTRAVKMMDDGQIDESIKLLEEAQKLDPEKIDYPYEIAYAHSIKKEYNESLKILEKLTKHKNVNEKVFQMMGNCYSYQGNDKKSNKTYERGLKKFPNSGCLRLELGINQLSSKNYQKALSYFEKGICVDPSFPSNYFWTAKLYLSTTEKMWGMIYGEIFLNLEKNSKRTEEISKLLYDTYKSQIQIKSGDTISVSFSRNMRINVDHLSDDYKFKLPFGMIYEPVLLMSLGNPKVIDLKSLDTIRTNFIGNYFLKKFNETYPNVLFDYQNLVLKAGHMDAYNHWILMSGDEEAFEKWRKSNPDKWEKFVDWFIKNPLKLDEKHKFFTGQY